MTEPVWLANLSQVDALAEELNAKLEHWRPKTSAQVRALVTEIIARADEDTLDLGRSRAVEQEVLGLIDDEGIAHVA